MLVIARQLRSLITLRAVVVGMALLVVFAAFIALARITNAAINPTAIRATLAQLGAWAPLALIVALAGVLVIPIVPASIFQISAGLVFGPFLGLVCVVVADVLGASIGFGLARYGGKSFLARYLSSAAQTKLENLTNRITWRGVILLRLLPGPTYPLVSFAAGYSSLSYARYILASLMGVLPGLALLVLVGDFAERSPILALVLAALLVIGLVIIGHLINRNRQGDSDTDV